MTKCELCGAEVDLPFECSFCGGYFCMGHRLPENHDCSGAPARTPLGAWKSKKSPLVKSPKGKEVEMVTSEGDYHFKKQKLTAYDLPKKPVKVGEKEPSRARRLLDVSLRPRKLLLSLKLWFLVFLAVVSLISLMEGSRPAQFYQSVPDSLKYVIYIFAAGIGVWSGYRVFEKCDYNPRSDRGLFALKLLSGGIFVVAILTFIFGIFFLSGLLTQTQSGLFIAEASLSRETVSVFLIVLSFVLMILSAYLMFKFERRSGIIVYRR